MIPVQLRRGKVTASSRSRRATLGSQPALAVDPRGPAPPQRLALDLTPVERLPSDALTPRQTEILMLVADGLIGTEIAALLVVSPHTVAAHRKQILYRLGVRSLQHAVAVGFREGILR